MCGKGRYEKGRWNGGVLAKKCCECCELGIIYSYNNKWERYDMTVSHIYIQYPYIYLCLCVVKTSPCVVLCARVMGSLFILLTLYL